MIRIIQRFTNNEETTVNIQKPTISYDRQLTEEKSIKVSSS
jgi:hypothetical protein